MSAAFRSSPCLRAVMAYSTKRIEFLVTTPISINKPISEGIEKLIPVANSATKAPPIESGKAPRIVIGCKKSWNNSTRII